MDRASEEFLARACFASDQNGGVGRRDFGDTCKDSLQSRRFANDLLEHGCFVNFFPQRDVFFVELVPQFLDFIQSVLEVTFGSFAFGDVLMDGNDIFRASFGVS